MDPLAVRLAMDGGRSTHMRAGGGPTIIEAEVYRYFHQNGPYPGSAFGYRTKEEETSWRDRDPLDVLRQQAVRRGLTTDEELAQREKDVLVGHAQPSVRSSSSPRRAASPARDGCARRCGPTPSFVDVGVRGDLSELEGSRYAEPEDLDERARPSASSSTWSAR